MWNGVSNYLSSSDAQWLEILSAPLVERIISTKCYGQSYDGEADILRVRTGTVLLTNIC